MTAARRAHRSGKHAAAILVPLVVGAIVSVALGAYGWVHEPTQRPVFLGPFDTIIAMKVWLTTSVLMLAVVQLMTALWMYGKLGIRAPVWVGMLHRGTGTAAVLMTVPVAFHCLWSLGFQNYDTRVWAHSLLGCMFYGAFVAKVLTLHSRRVPGWALPWVAGLLFTVLVAVGATSAGWYFNSVGFPS